MSLEALAVVLAGVACHALSNPEAKHSAAGAAKCAGRGFALVWLSGMVRAAAAVRLLALVWQPQPPQFTFAMWAAIVASNLLHVVYSLVLQQGWRVGDFATVYAVARCSGPVFTVAAAVLSLGERPSTAGRAGVTAVLAGVFVSCRHLSRCEAAARSSAAGASGRCSADAERGRLPGIGDVGGVDGGVMASDRRVMALARPRIRAGRGRLCRCRNRPPARAPAPPAPAGPSGAFFGALS